MIQVLTKEHIVDIADLDQLCFPVGSFPEDVIAPMFNMDGFVALGQYEGKQLICCLLGHSIFDEGELWSIATHPNHRGKGFAQAIFKQFEDSLKTKGVERLFWEVRVSNTGAQRFYDKLGAECFGERKGFYTAEGNSPAEDALLYRYQF